MNRLIILGLSVPVFLAACKNKQGANATDPAAAPPAEGVAADGAAQLGGTSPADSLVLTFERTPCFGMCKAYRVQVYRSGYARYEGRAHVEVMGHAQSRLDQATLQELVQKARAMGFADLKDSYDSQVTDLPSTIVRIVAHGMDKTVTARAGVPPHFRAYADQLEEALLPLPWKPIPAQD